MKDHAQTFDIAEYGLSGAPSEKVPLTYLPRSAYTSTLDTEPYELQTFWQDYISDYWTTALAYFLSLALTLRLCQFLIRKVS